jgi:prepilin-type N-terminal cleavage/methylation domain-containing protein
VTGLKAIKDLRAGFTLLEVVIAMTIVGLGVVTLIQIFSLGLRLGARSAVSTEAMAYGREVMDEFLVRPKLDEGSEQGTFPGKGRWSVQVRAVRDPSGTLSLGSDWELREVGLDLVMLDAGRERRVELKTLRLMKKKNG